MFESLSDRLGAVFEKLQGLERFRARIYGFAAQIHVLRAKEIRYV